MWSEFLERDRREKVVIVENDERSGRAIKGIRNFEADDPHNRMFRRISSSRNEALRRREYRTLALQRSQSRDSSKGLRRGERGIIPQCKSKSKNKASFGPTSVYERLMTAQSPRVLHMIAPVAGKMDRTLNPREF